MSIVAPLARKLGLGDAIFIGLGAMIGAGIFAAFAPAAASAGAGLLIGLVIAAVVAFCNATSTAQLAAQYPTSGGTYIYGHERLGQWPGFLAGWSFVIGKTASGAAMALTFAAYAVPADWQKPAAVAAILALATVNYFGITRTAQLTKIIVCCVLVVLIFVIVTGFSTSAHPPAAADYGMFDHGWYGILQSAGLLFFAFAGYARIATLGEEVRNPARSIPRAIVVALSIAVALYSLIAVTLLRAFEPHNLAGLSAPLVHLVAQSPWGWAAPVVQVGAAVAALGALLALVAGVGRTVLAMARNGDAPKWLAAVHPVYKVPHHAEIVLAGVMCVLVLTLDVRAAIGFSSFGVLLYYFIANAAALTQTRGNRRYPRVLAVVGGVSCLVLVATLPAPSIIGGLIVLLGGVLYRVARLRSSRGSESG